MLHEKQKLLRSKFVKKINKLKKIIFLKSATLCHLHSFQSRLFVFFFFPWTENISFGSALLRDR